MAAEGTLPGDTLYPVKVYVNERVAGSFSVSSKSKVKWEATLIERRLEEAEELLARGRLSAQAEGELAHRVDASATKANKHIMELHSSGETESAGEVSADLESFLGAHHKILALLAKDKTEGEKEPKAIVVEVEKGSGLIGGVRVQIETRVAAGDDAGASGFAEGKLKAAERKLAEVRKFIGKKASSLEAEVKAKIEVQLKASDAAIVEAKVNIKAKSYTEAFRLLQNAMQLAQDAKLYINARVNLNLTIDPSLLDLGIAGDSDGGVSAATFLNNQRDDKKQQEPNRSDDWESDESKKEEKREPLNGVESNTKTRIEIKSPVNIDGRINANSWIRL